MPSYDSDDVSAAWTAYHNWYDTAFSTESNRGPSVEQSPYAKDFKRLASAIAYAGIPPTQFVNLCGDIVERKSRRSVTPGDFSKGDYLAYVLMLCDTEMMQFTIEEAYRTLRRRLAGDRTSPIATVAAGMLDFPRIVALYAMCRVDAALDVAPRAGPGTAEFAKTHAQAIANDIALNPAFRRKIEEEFDIGDTLISIAHNAINRKWVEL